MIKQAVILAAGEGNRLRPFTAYKPKAMLSIAGKPVLQYVIEALAQNGIRDIVLVVGYKREQIFDYIGSGDQFGVNITYVTQEKQLGTAHALAQAQNLVNDEFLVLSGDKLIDASTIAQFVKVKSDAMLIKRVENPDRYGVVDIEDGLVKGIVEQPPEPKSNMVSMRIYALSKQVFSFIESELVLSNVFNKMITQGKPVYAYESDAPWLDIIYPWDILTQNGLFLHRIKAEMGGTVERGVYIKGPALVGKDTVIRSGSYIVGPIIIGSGCTIGPNACILSPVSIGDNVTIASFAEIRNSVISDDTNIESSCTIHDSVIDKGCVIGGHFTALGRETEVKVNGEHHLVTIGAMLGEGCTINSGVVAQPGVIIGNYTRIEAMKLVSGKLPDKSLIL